MTRRLSVLALFLSTLVVVAVFASGFLPGDPPPWAAPALVGAIASLVTAMLALGAARGERGVAGLGWVLLFTFVVLAGGFGLALALPPETADGALWLGLPRRAAIVLYGIGLLPVLVLPLAYAATFDERTIRGEDVERVRRLAEEVRDGGRTPAVVDDGR